MSLTTVDSPEVIRRASEIPRIYGALARVKRDMPAVPKDRQTESGPKYAYRSAEDVVNASAPLFAREGVLVVPYIDRASRELRERANGTMVFSIMEITFTFFAEDGSFITAKVIGEASDVSDKASTKAQTVAERIAICKILSIPTKETAIDPEEGIQHEVTTNSAASRAATVMGAAKHAEDLKKYIQYAVKCAAGKGKQGDVMSSQDLRELRLVALEAGTRLRLKEDAMQWIDETLSDAANAFTETPDEPRDVEMASEPVHLGEVNDLLSKITDDNVEEMLRHVVSLYPQMNLEDQDQVRATAVNFDHPGFKQWVQMEISTVDELPGENRNVTALAAAGLIEDKTKAVLLVRGQARLSILKKGKK